MRTFHVKKATEFEEALIEHGIRFEHPNDDPNMFDVDDDAVDVVDDIARKMMIDAYIEDPLVTREDTQSD